jgi:hypothetical protein
MIDLAGAMPRHFAVISSSYRRIACTEMKIPPGEPSGRQKRIMLTKARAAAGPAPIRDFRVEGP